MRIRIKCSFVHKIIQHVEYPTPMARVAKITKYDTAHLRKQLMSDLSFSEIEVPSWIRGYHAYKDYWQIKIDHYFFFEKI